jgi:hypothetical protein
MSDFEFLARITAAATETTAPPIAHKKRPPGVQNIRLPSIHGN